MSAPGSPAAEGIGAGTDAAAAMLAAWARVWNPLLLRADKAASWEALGLPAPIHEVEPACWSVFHAALPAPAVPLLLHSLTGMDGSQAREDWLRAIHHLQLEWTDRVIAPDHLATACEVLAAALENDDRVLVRELLARYLEPWCAEARRRLAETGTAAATILQCFSADVAGLAERFAT
jgi:hypothetical protein